MDIIWRSSNKVGEELDVVATANSTEMVRSLVASKVGISLLNMKPRDAPAYAGNNICCLPITDSSSGVTLSLGFAPGPQRRPVKMFIDSCVAFFAPSLKSELTVTNV